jgi:hypothetical protein
VLSEPFRLPGEANLGFDAGYDFNVIEKDAAIPFDLNELTPQVIDDALPSWLKLIICERLLRSCSMPRDLVVQDNLSTIFVDLDDGITPTQLGFNMSQLAGNFRFDWITPFEGLI